MSGNIPSLARVALNQPWPLQPSSLTSVTMTESRSTITSSTMNNLLDGLALLSPRTWYGILQSQTHSSFNIFDGIVLAQSILASLLPLLVLTYAFKKVGSIRQREFLWKIVTPVVGLSPWTLSALYNICRQCIYLFPPMLFYWTGRTEALPSAVKNLQLRVQQGRATRHRRYDVYWPTTIDPRIPAQASEYTSHSHNLPQKAILVLPGFGISHVAYSEVASRFSDAGFVVVVVSMEPLRLAHRHLGADAVSITRIMRRVQGDNDHFQWSLLGHSAGGFGAMHLFEKLRRQPAPTLSIHTHTRTRTRTHIHKLILWGCAAIIDMSTDLSQLLFQEEDSPAILILQATNDSLLELTKPFQETFEKHFPKHQTVTEWIAGGTHQGFASYESTWVGSPDMATAIAYVDQQDQACNKTIAFLRSSDVNN